MKKILSISILISLCSINNVQAFEFKNVLTNAIKAASSVESVNSAEVDSALKSSISTMNSRLALTDKNIQDAFMSLVSTLSPAEDVKRIQAKIDAINANSKLTSAEKSAQLSQIISDYENDLKNADREIKKQLQLASDETNAELKAALEKLISTTAGYTTLTGDASSIAGQFATNPSLAVSMPEDFAEISKTIKMLNTNLKSLNELISQVMSLCN